MCVRNGGEGVFEGGICELGTWRAAGTGGGPQVALDLPYAGRMKFCGSPKMSLGHFSTFSCSLASLRPTFHAISSYFPRTSL